MPKLTAMGVKNAKPGRHGDGDGLYLMVKPSGARSWVLRLQTGKKRQDIGLGAVELGARDQGSPILDVPLLQRRLLTLSEARDKASLLRGFAKAGLSPLQERDRDRAKPKIPTFAEAVDKVQAELSKSWTDKTAKAFKSTLQDHAVPSIGKLPVSDITAANVLAALQPIWAAKPEQARKVRHRILTVLAYAKAHGWRTEAVPTAKELGSGLSKPAKRQHFAAVPYPEVPAVVVDVLGQQQTVSRLALLFTILTAARSGEVRAAQWEHIDLKARTWARPADLMKSREAHVVTLSGAAIAVLERAKAHGQAGLIFPSARPGRPLSDMTLAKALRASGRSETVHGFRSSFRDWAAEKMPTTPGIVAEIALAHSVGNATEKSYRRTDLLELRAELLEAWGRFAAPQLGEGGAA